jgi:hypothetical protein
VAINLNQTPGGAGTNTKALAFVAVEVQAGVQVITVGDSTPTTHCGHRRAERATRDGVS